MLPAVNESTAISASHSVKVITLDGDCINAGGSLTGGSIRKDSAGILGRAREIEDLKSRIVKTEQKLSVSEARRQELDGQTGDIKREIAQLNEQLKFFAMEREKAESEYRNVATRLEELETGLTDAEKMIHEISAEKLKLADDLEELDVPAVVRDVAVHQQEVEVVAEIAAAAATCLNGLLLRHKLTQKEIARRGIATLCAETDNRQPRCDVMLFL